jgi:hypothetical protein
VVLWEEVLAVASKRANIMAMIRTEINTFQENECRRYPVPLPRILEPK